MHRHSAHARALLVTAAWISIASLGACGGGTSDTDGGDGDGNGDVIAPACAFTADTKHIFTSPIIPIEAVHSTLPLGDMSPETFEEAFPNREMGFAIKGSAWEVPVVAPTKIYVESFEITYFLDDFPEAFKRGQADFSLTFWACDKIWGELHHITGLSETLVGALAQHMGTTADDLLSREVSTPKGNVTCSLDEINQDLNGAAKYACIESWLGVSEGEQPTHVACRDEGTLRGCSIGFTHDGGDFLVLEDGASIGTTAGFEGSNFHPGFDFNMIDLRHTWSYVNPARLGDPQGMRARSYLNAACPYEYFTDDDYREALMGTVSNYYGTRTDALAPCGTLDIGVPNTAAGNWFFAGAMDAATLKNLNLTDHHVLFHENVLALARDVIEPETMMVISTSLTDVVHDAQGVAQLVRIEIGEADHHNIAFDAMLPGETYCIEGTHSLPPASAAYLLRFTNGTTAVDAELLLQPVGTACPQDAAAWILEPQSALRFVR